MLSSSLGLILILKAFWVICFNQGIIIFVAVPVFVFSLTLTQIREGELYPRDHGRGWLYVWSRSCIYVIYCCIFTKLAWMFHIRKLMDLSWKLNLCRRFQMLEEVKVLVQINKWAGFLDRHVYVIQGAFYMYIHLSGLYAESEPFIWNVGEGFFFNKSRCFLLIISKLLLS